jgi:hypothetical protein
MSSLIALLVVAYVARMVLSDWKDRPPAIRPDAEVGRLREEMDDLSAQVRRLTEEQSFLLRLLAEGRTPAALASVGADEAETTTDRPNPEMPDGDA